MTTNLETLMSQLAEEPLGEEVNFAALEDERGRRVPPVQPGTYTLRLPANLADAWSPKPMETQRGKRVFVVLDDEHPLLVVAGAPAMVGRSVRTIISNQEMNRAKRGEPERLVATSDYLLRALGFTGSLRRGANVDFIRLLNSYAGAAFGASVRWSATCNPKRVKYVLVEGKAVKAVVDGRELKGCGNRLYQESWPREADGSYKPRVTCKCGAILDPFIDLEQFRPAVA